MRISFKKNIRYKNKIWEKTLKYNDFSIIMVSECKSEKIFSKDKKKVFHTQIKGLIYRGMKKIQEEEYVSNRKKRKVGR